MCPRQDSNLRPCLRRAVLYPLSYGGLMARSAVMYYRPTDAELISRPSRD
jgi:hypothetical protein